MRLPIAIVVALFFALSDIHAAEGPKDFVLMSYCISDGVYRFALLSAADFTAVTNKVSGHRREFPKAGYLTSVSELKRTLEGRVPEGSVIEWRQWKPAETCYPPKPIIDDIRAFAHSRHMKIQVPGYDSAE
jgi:hypothetical protein